MNTSLPLVIYGAGGLGREMILHAGRTGRIITGFLDDATDKGPMVDGIRVLGDINWLKQNSGEIFLAFGNPLVKRKVFESVKTLPGFKLSEKIIDPDSRLLNPEQIQVGKGTVITAGAVLTTGIVIGAMVLINLNTTIGHDTTIGDFSSVMPGCNIAGNVKIGSGVLIGSGVNILGGLEIGDDVIIGSGSVVTKNIRSGIKVTGVPAREMIR